VKRAGGDNSDRIGSEFRLEVKDCLEALQLAKDLSWVSLAPSDLETEENEGCCGRNGGFDAVEYEFLDNPLNADLHEVQCVGWRVEQREHTTVEIKYALRNQQVVEGLELGTLRYHSIPPTS
jgi:hypothetical protein